MTALIVGGAGYIGSHVALRLQQSGERVVVVDDLSTGDARRVDASTLHQIDVRDPGSAGALRALMERQQVDTVYHFAARKSVERSVSEPLATYRTNVAGLSSVLHASTEAGVSRLIFSSTAAVYGATTTPLITETHPCAPVNPYGHSKLAGEWLCQAVHAATGLKIARLRYFNVAGAGVPRLGERSAPNLIPQVLSRLREGQPPLVFGTDYATPDGSCVRDYVHVADVAEAHIAASAALSDAAPFLTLNIGTGLGHSVLEVIERAQAITGITLAPTLLGRRAGDPPAVIAAVDAIRDLTGWRAHHGLDSMIQSSWEAITAER